MKAFISLICGLLLTSLPLVAQSSKTIDALKSIVKEAGFDYNAQSSAIVFQSPANKEEVYKITASRLNSGLCLELQQRGIAFDATDRTPVGRRALLNAANILNNESPSVKVNVDFKEGRISFMQVLMVNKLTDLTSTQLVLYVQAFDGVKERFERERKLQQQRVVEAVAADSANIVTRFEQQRRQQADEAARRQAGEVVVISQDHSLLIVSKLEVANCEANGKAISKYGASINAAKARFLSLCVTAEAAEAGNYTLCATITTPGGQPMLPSKEARYTIVARDVRFDRKNREQTVTLGQFGSNESVWKAGTYSVALYDGDGKRLGTFPFTLD